MKIGKRKCLIFTVFALGCISQELKAGTVAYNLVGSVPAIESGTFSAVILNDDGSFTPINTSFSNRLGTINFNLQFTLDLDEDPLQLPVLATGSFTAGDLTVPAGLLYSFQNSTPGSGPDSFQIYGFDPAAPVNFYGDFSFVDPTGNFFETGSLTGVVIHSSITVISGGRGLPDFDATGISDSLAPVPEPNSLALLGSGVGALATLGVIRRRYRARIFQ